ncbi:DUF4136 domain-containing protein [Thalassotalea aquiviva]|uniref:DUF4136 domain-containing protein n=1 Tax=Thalassotalea aquiviva TaxID=3242415 RepID=UPI00352B8D08
MFKKLSLICFVGFFIGACQSTYDPKLNFDVNEKVDTTNYQTFTWLNESKAIATPKRMSPILKLEIADSIEKKLLSQGFKLVSNQEEADFTVSFSVGSRDKIKVNSYPSSYHSFTWGRRYYGGYYGAGFSAPWPNETEVRQYTEGMLAIDIYDVKTKQPAWHGWATKKLKKSDAKDRSATLELVVSEILNQFKR